MSFAAGQARIRGFIEAVTDGGVAGWAFREGDPAPLVLTLSVDGVPASEAACAIERADVWEARGDVREKSGHGARLGFHFSIPAACFDGMPHRFDLLIASGESAELATIGRPVGWIREFSFPSVAVIGRVEPAGNGEVIYGWVVVVDRMRGTKRTANLVQVTSSTGASVALTAGMPRPDVARALDCGEACGFRFVTPPELSGPDGATLSFRVQPEDLDFAPHPIAIPANAAPPLQVVMPAEVKPVEAAPDIPVEIPAAEQPVVAPPVADDAAPEDAFPVEIVEDAPHEDAAAAAALHDDPDDPRLRFIGLPRRALFGMAERLAEKRAAVLPRPVKIPDGYYATAIEQMVAQELDRAFYLATY
ncbi:MAG: hypothetical protein NT133_21400, partial [Alphaproteobacteria bacterium]|nr:hypothetical protein [Alphaproteobacteria bacterium]